MSLQDVTSLTGGFGQSITDWQLNDDRIFTGTLSSVLPASDPSFVSGYFTLKLNPNDTDANAILQKKVTQSLTTSGQITADSATHFTVFLIHVFSGDYEGLVSAGPSYWWDFLGISTNGITARLATGQVSFLQTVTQTNVAGTPAALPNNGLPQFRGFFPASPQTITGLSSVFNKGDFGYNQFPVAGQPIGWTCVTGGTPGTWRAWPNL